MRPLNFLKQFKSKRYSPEMLNAIEHVLEFCDHVTQRQIYVTGSDEYDHRLLWAFSQSLNFYGCNFPIGKVTLVTACYEQWVAKIGINEAVVLNELGARMLSYLHNSIYDIRYYRKLFGEFTYYRYIKKLKEKKPG